MIQSFAPDEVTPEQAMQIGEELCDRYLKGDYQYVIAVHNDKDHLHCHIIFNNTNLYNGLSFTTEHNQGRKSERAWAELREISDEICKEHGLSLIDPKGKGVSHHERTMQKEGKSWKDKLRIRIAEVMLYSRDFADFLRNCTFSGIEYVYTPKNKYKLKFKLSGDGQQRFTRADTLGADYTPERITEQIAEIQEKLSEANITPDMLIEPPKQITAPKTEPKPIPPKPAEPVQNNRLISDEFLARVREQKASQTPQPTATQTAPKPDTDRVVITAEEFLAPLYDKPETPPPAPQSTESKAPEKKNDEWASIRGMRNSDKIIAELEASGITSFYDFSGFLHNTHHDDDHTAELAELKTHIKTVETIIAKMKHYNELLPTYNEYAGLSGWKQSRYRKKHSEEIEDFEQTKAYIKEHITKYTSDGSQPLMKDLQGLLKRMKAKRDELLPKQKAYIIKHDTAMKYTRQVRQYLNEQHMKREREKSRQRTQTKNKNSYLE
ncbi:Relaxase/Mobilisation nuclease domain-containing protein [Ruminococcus albus]|uniref:Relaxase/Mobilisation nuclease domain-containing protein n=1 Tax=Ruminococcus albus TaxID=1264 RepID=A0A1I1JTG8_RUMAL|nr:Relaxase/Mobilisation nuclease domain-containing protein [Ruminococcus albus]